MPPPVACAQALDAGTSRGPRFTEVLRGRMEAEIDRIIAPQVDALVGGCPYQATGVRSAARCGSRGRARITKLGHRIRRRPRPGKSDGAEVELLHAREFEVARLVAQRKTNPEIAAALFLSQKTVETHLRNMFHKLSVNSRVELAQAVSRLGGEQGG